MGNRIGAWAEVQGRSPVPSVEDVTAWPLPWKSYHMNMIGKSINVFQGPNNLQGRCDGVAEEVKALGWLSVHCCRLRLVLGVR